MINKTKLFYYFIILYYHITIEIPQSTNKNQMANLVTLTSPEMDKPKLHHLNVYRKS